MYKYLFALLFCSFAGLLSAQGWERVYGGSGQDDLSGVAATPDGGFVMIGYYNANSQAYLLKADANGDLQFNKKIPLFDGVAGRAVVLTQDGGYALAGYTKKAAILPATGFQRDFCLLKTDANGNLLWSKTYGTASGNEEANDLVELPDGSLVAVGYRKAGEDVMVIKTDATGQQIGTTKFFGAPTSKEMGNSIALASNGDVVVVGESKATTGSNSEVLVLRMDASINLLWQQTYDAVPMVDDVAFATVMANDGGIVMAGRSYGNGLIMKVPGDGVAQAIWVNADADSSGFYGLDKDLTGGYYVGGFGDLSGAQTDLKVARFNADGALLWSRTVGRPGIDVGKAVVTTPRDGGVAIVGTSEPFYDQQGSGQPDGYLVKADANGVVFNSYLRGKIFRDFNGNCALDDGEPPLRDWIIKATSPHLTRYTVSRGNGSYQIAVDTGTYTITLVTANNYWKTCNGAVTASLANFADTVNTDIPVRGEFDCPRNEVDIATPLLNRCAENTYTVRYCNSGTVPSLNTEVVVQLDTFLTLTSSSVNATSLGGNSYRFNVGTLVNGDCGNFTFTAFLSCDNTLTGQAYCTKAHIYPDSSCIPNNWNGAFVEARATCDGDTVRMFLKNIGISPTSDEIGYVIAEDLVMLTAPNDPNNTIPPIGVGLEVPVFQQKANGKTYRIIADQEATYPGLSHPTAAVEGCVTDTTIAPTSSGFYTMFPEDDADAFVSTDCQESYETDFNPAYLKRGHPKGYDVAYHYVSPQTDLDFLIRFTNTGNDTVQLITIRDTLSAALDPATVHPGAASHPYQLDIYGDGIIQFTLPNVNLLPDSSANEGFVRFRVSQKPNLDPCGTVIFNSAAVYFDFNAPQHTNETFHTVCSFDSFIVVKTMEYFVPNADLKVYPNPMVDGATFELKGIDAHQYRLDLYDPQGRTISSQIFNQPTFQLFRHQLPAGLILYRLTADGQPVAAGKLLVQSRQ